MGGLRFAAVVLVILIASCAGQAANRVRPSAHEPQFQPFPQLPSPRQVAARTPPLIPQQSGSGRLLFGAYALQQHFAQNVQAVDELAVFQPHYSAESPALANLALATYSFDLNDYSGAAIITLDWQAPAPPGEELYLGLGNFDHDCWDWFSGALLTGDKLELPSLSPYRDRYSKLVLAVILLGEESASLKSVLIGERWLVAGVDLTELYAPVLDFETQAVEDDWAARNPLEQDYTVEAQDIDEDGFRRVVISHLVDGNRHYGAARIPPYGVTDMYPVLVYCHAGTNGAFIGTFDMFDLDIGSSEIKNNYVLVLPSFRSEPLYGGTLGDYLSEGPAGYYDHDADDALALLDCVVNHYHEADDSRVIALGLSRGAQVAQRISQRDPRVKAVVDFYGMTDYWLPEEQQYVVDDLALAAGGEASLPYVQGLHDGELTIWDVRLAMCRWSTAYYTDLFPRLQIHHGVMDIAVPVAHSDRLVSALETVPDGDYVYYRYPEGNHNPSTLPDCWPRVQSLLLEYLD